MAPTVQPVRSPTPPENPQTSVSPSLPPDATRPSPASSEVPSPASSPNEKSSPEAGAGPVSSPASSTGVKPSRNPDATATAPEPATKEPIEQNSPSATPVSNPTASQAVSPSGSDSDPENTGTGSKSPGASSEANASPDVSPGQSPSSPVSTPDGTINPAPSARPTPNTTPNEETPDGRNQDSPKPYETTSGVSPGSSVSPDEGEGPSDSSSPTSSTRASPDSETATGTSPNPSVSDSVDSSVTTSSVPSPTVSDGSYSPSPVSSPSAEDTGAGSSSVEPTSSGEAGKAASISPSESDGSATSSPSDEESKPVPSSTPALTPSPDVLSATPSSQSDRPEPSKGSKDGESNSTVLPPSVSPPRESDEESSTKNSPSPSNEKDPARLDKDTSDEPSVDGPATGAGPSPGGTKSDDSDGKNDKGNNGGPLGSTGARAGISVAALVAVALVSIAAYKIYGILPEDSLRSALRLSGMSEQAPSPPSSPTPPPDESRFLKKWIKPSELPESAVAAGEAVAAAVGGQFAGLMRPGTEKVRPPQVITRTAQPELLTAISDLGATDSRSLASPLSSLSDGVPSVDGVEQAMMGGLVAGMTIPGMIGANRRPKVDLIVVMDASGSLSWQEYRTTKEFFTRAGGLLDSVMSLGAHGSRIAFVEYAYDSVVVSELDDDVDRVKRRVLSAFQGDANNWDRDALYIYEVDENFGGNALRKVNSLRTRGHQTAGLQATDGTPVDDGWIDPEELSIANAAEVPPAMNGLSREVYMALKWSRLEMLPPLANRDLELKMQRANRLRRILLVNAGEFTDGGSVELGLSSAKHETDEMEHRGIAIITLGIGAQQDPGLEQLSTGDPAAHFSVQSTDDVDPILPDITHMILSPRFRPSNTKLVQEPAPVFFKGKLRERFGRSDRSSKPELSTDSAERKKVWQRKLGLRKTSPKFIFKEPPAPRICDSIIHDVHESDLPPWFRDS